MRQEEAKEGLRKLLSIESFSEHVSGQETSSEATFSSHDAGWDHIMEKDGCQYILRNLNILNQNLLIDVMALKTQRIWILNFLPTVPVILK